MIKVPITLNFDTDEVIGEFTIEEKYAKMLCEFPESIVLRQSYIDLKHELREISIVRKPIFKP